MRTLAVKKINDLQFLAEVDQGPKKLIDWAEEHKEEIDFWLKEKGALLLRGLSLTSSMQFGKMLEVLFGESLLQYNHRSTPRTELRGNIYTATEYHSEQLIVQHNEQAYTNEWPMRIGFFCLLPSDKGGETPIADSRRIYEEIPKVIREKFTEKGLMYVRNYSNLDLSWTEVFNTDDPKVVGNYCQENGIEYQWKSDNGLKTSQKLPAIARHPSTGEQLWFNQAHLFHVSALEQSVRHGLLSMGKENLPRNVYFSDGSDIPDEDLAVIREVYQRCKVRFLWKRGDLMLLDNMLFSHGREPFSGERRILVGMAKSKRYSTE